jgi:4-hydroxy-4-methyl-2-oxoglutarate aldolase
MNYLNETISYIRKNRVSTTEVADAMGKVGALPNLLPINSDQFKVGKVRCVFTAFESNWDVHEQAKDIQPGEVVIVFTHRCEDRAILGELVAKFILLYQQAEALVIDGRIRDAHAIRRQNYSVWSSGVSPIGCFNEERAPFPEEERNAILDQYGSGIAVCDEGGVVIIPNHLIGEDMLARLHRIEMQEDIWFFCLDTLKWDTKKIVCDKAYLNETNLLSKTHISQIEELKKPLDS